MKKEEMLNSPEFKELVEEVVLNLPCNNAKSEIEKTIDSLRKQYQPTWNIKAYKQKRTNIDEADKIYFQDRQLNYIFCLGSDNMEGLCSERIVNVEKLKDNPFFEIYSVERLSDGEVFTLGDRVQTRFSGPIFTLTGFKIVEEINDIALGIGQTTICSIRTAKKIKKFGVTEDGVEVYQGNQIWGVDHTSIWE